MPCLPWLLNVPPDIHVSEKPCLSLSEPRTYLDCVCACMFDMVVIYTRFFSSATTVQIKRSWWLVCLKISKRVFVTSENHIISGCTTYSIWTASDLPISVCIYCSHSWWFHHGCRPLTTDHVSLCSQGWAVVHSNSYYIIVPFIIMVVRFSKYNYGQTS